MRLATIQTEFGPRAALVHGDRYIDLHGSEPTFPADMRELLERGPAVWRMATGLIDEPHARFYEAGEVKLLPPVSDPRKIVCLGLNYADHAKESGATLPRDPILFSKYATALIGHEDAVVLPAVSQEVDYEAEMVIVIGKEGRHIPADLASDYVAGYTVGNDVSARDWQLKKDGKQWMVGKTFDTFAPTGPYLITADEIPDPHKLAIRLRLNGQTMQDSNTSQLIFPVGRIIEYISSVCTLQPGDLIFTGTPAGVGFARKPPVFLKAGDVVEVEIEGLGVLRNRVIRTGQTA
jgi:2-keto-4-pentenoate hydratase/2-oxohepta-3-ene-1,7-dioic acid hydratase in catechol pathway